MLASKVGPRMAKFMAQNDMSIDTLAEVLVVVALVSVALGVALARFDGFASPVQTAGDLVAGMLQHTRARAMATTTSRPSSAWSRTCR